MFNVYDTTKVTVELWELIQSGFDIWEGFTFDPAPNARTPIYDEERLRRVIENRYYFRQIGQETPQRFRFMMQAKLREVFPYYAQLYESAQLMADVEDPFQAYDLTEEYTEHRSNEGTTSGTSTLANSSERSENRSSTNEATQTGTDGTTETKEGENHSTAKFSDTPQGSISNLDSHLTNATVTDSDASETASTQRTTSETLNSSASDELSMEGSENSTGSSEGSSSETGETTYTLTRKGNIGVQPLGKEVEALRASYINIDKMIADELRDLFLMVY